MAPHSSTLAWKIPWMEEPGRLQSMGLLRVGYDWATSLSIFTFMHWRRKWQPTRLPHPWDSPGKNTGVGCHFLLQCMKVKIESEVVQLCLTLSDPMDCSSPGSSVHGIFQARVLTSNILLQKCIHPSAPAPSILYPALGGSGWGTCVHPWWIHVDVWQNQYNIVK